MGGQERSNQKRVFVTGGGSGIGLAIAQNFCGAGHQVIIAGRNKSKLEAAGHEYVEIDVTDEQSVIDGVNSAGDIDIFVANAGAAATAPALKTDRETWDQMLSVNLTSTYLCARAAIPQMVERKWGRYIVVASTAALKGYSYVGAYAAAKHGVLGWVKTLALELSKTGVTANAICPGYTDTPLVDEALEKVMAKTGKNRKDALAAFVSGNPMGRLIDPSEVAGAALWLASDAAASVNGQSITIDGGETVS
ncbi:MAG: SDR family oxidoreductase [Marinicaulis sp.]|nr:SDR family oxidoreductase [Marinicaulis sp.]NNL87737.1 SDR family oxidoreductase [Marinicaulis sp.]